MEWKNMGIILFMINILFGYQIMEIPVDDKITCIKFYENQKLLLGLNHDKIIFYDIAKKEEVSQITSSYLFFPTAIDVNEKYLFTNSLINGKNYLLKFSLKKGGLVQKPVLHQTGNKNIFYCKPDSSIIVCQSHFTKYNEYQERWDSNNLHPSAEEKLAWQKFYKNKIAYTLTKYSKDFDLIDSCDFVGRRGEDYIAYERLPGLEAFAVDKEKNIYVFHGSKGYEIKKYSYDFKLLQTIRGRNENFIPIPDQLNIEKVQRMKNINSSYSQVGDIFVIEKYVFVFYYNYSTDANTQYYYDIYNQSGKLIHSGISNYYFCAKDLKNNIYIYVNRKQHGIIHKLFNKKPDLLIGFSIEQLLESDLTTNYVRKILEQKDEK